MQYICMCMSFCAVFFTLLYVYDEHFRCVLQVANAEFYVAL